jgi:hypothetical protein
MPRINPSGGQGGSIPPLNTPAARSPIAPTTAPAASKPTAAPKLTAAYTEDPKPTTRPQPKATEPVALLPEEAAFALPKPFVQDVQRIAQQAGYVGLTETAIKRAMIDGDGLFVDVSA